MEPTHAGRTIGTLMPYILVFYNSGGLIFNYFLYNSNSHFSVFTSYYTINILLTIFSLIMSVVFFTMMDPIVEMFENMPPKRTETRDGKSLKYENVW